MSSLSLFDAPASQVTYEMLADFLGEQNRDRLFLESQVLEFKRQLDGAKVVAAICAMANTDGGLILVGVDEKHPSNHPGVAASSQDRLVGQCRDLLDPVVIPEIIPVALPDGSAVVLVLRVAPAGAFDLPVFAGSRVWMRVPGATVRATREQVLHLIDRARADMGKGQQFGMALTSLYMPSSAAGLPAADSAVPDVRLRVAAALPLRTNAYGTLVLGSELRQQLMGAVDDSPLAKWAAGRHADHLTQPGWSVSQARSDSWRVRRPVARRFDPRVELGLQARFDGGRLTYAIDVDLSLVDKRKGPRVAELLDVADGLLRMLAVSRTAMFEVFAGLLPIGLGAGYDGDVIAWVMPAEPGLNDALNLGELPHDVPTEHGLRAGQRSFPPRANPLEDRQEVRDWLVQMLLDDAVSNAEHEADSIMERTTTSGPGHWL